MSLVFDYDYERYKNKYKLLREHKTDTGINPCNAVKHEYFTITKTGIVTVKVGYVWDGATGGLDTKDFMRGSLIHDVLCQAVAEKLLHKAYRPKADKLLYKMLLEDGMPKWRALYVYNFIKLYVWIKY